MLDTFLLLKGEYQDRLRALSRRMGGEPPRWPLWIDSRRGDWWLVGQTGGDVVLPNTRGCRTWIEALDRAERWFNIYSRSHRPKGSGSP